MTRQAHAFAIFIVLAAELTLGRTTADERHNLASEDGNGVGARTHFLKLEPFFELKFHGPHIGGPPMPGGPPGGAPPAPPAVTACQP